MRRKSVVLIMVVVLATSVLMVGCTPEQTLAFVGLWRFVSGPDTELMDIAKTLFAITGTGAYLGTVNMNVTGYDEDKGHIATTVTSATGYYNTWSGNILWAYVIVGTIMYLQAGFLGSYPSDPMSGGIPYTAQ